MSPGLYAAGTAHAQLENCPPVVSSVPSNLGVGRLGEREGGDT